MLTDLFFLEKNSSDERVAVIFEDVNKNPVHIRYDKFLQTSIDLQQELYRLIQPSVKTDQRISIGISCRVTAQLPTCVYSIIQSGFVLLPLPAKPLASFINVLEKTGTKFVLLTQDDYEDVLNEDIQNGSLTIIQLKSLPTYFLLEIRSTWPVTRYRDSIIYITQSSGTTGEPKLIYVTAGSINSNILDLR